MKKFSELMEKSGDTAVFTFGRLNPPTTGHGKLIDAMAKEQGKNAGSKMHVFVSHSQDAKKNPLDYKRKVAYIRKMFPKYAKNITTDKAKTIFEVAVSLYNRGYKSIVMVVGSDRVDEFERLLNEYNGVQSKHGYYGFDNVEVVSAGDRDPDAEGLEGMSASKMRSAAVDGDLDSFKQGVPDGFNDAEKLYRDVRKSMGIREEKDMGEMDTYEKMRDDYLTGKIWNVGDIVEAKGVSGEIVRKGTNYISFMEENGKVHKAWLHEIELDEKSWFLKAKAKIDQMSHPKAYEAMIKQFVGVMKNPPKQKTPASIAADIAREYSVSARALIQYINKLVDKGVIPKELKAEYQEESFSFNHFVKEMNGEMGTTELLKRYKKDTPGEMDEVKQDKDIKDRKGTQPAKYYATDITPSTKEKRAAHFAKKKSGPAPGDATAKTKLSIHTKKYKQMFGEQKIECPPATKDLAINTKNRDAATKKYNYGPLNVDEPGDYWEKIAKHWKTTEDAAKKSLCENCVAFDVSPRMKECLPGATSDDDGELGYCWMHHFKCHSARACHTWAKGGPIDKDKESNNWQERAFGENKDTKQNHVHEILDKDADISDYVKDFKKSDAPQFKGKSDKKKHKMAVAAYLSRNEALLDRVDQKLTENGHTDVASMKNKVAIAYKALEKMQSELSKLGDEDELPTWWTNKVATAVSRIDDMSDYLDTQVDEAYQLDEKIAGLIKKADKSGMPYGILKKVYDRGMAAWKTGHRPGTTPQQWAFARVNSFITKSSGTWGKADADLAKQVRGESIDEACWDTHKQVGMKKKGGKMVPNCVPKIEEKKKPTQKDALRSFLNDPQNDKKRAAANKAFSGGRATKSDKEKLRSVLKMEEFELNEWGEITEKDDKSGKELNNPTKGDIKKYKVYVKNDKGNVVKVEFGDPNMEIKRDDPARLKSFRARHNCDQKKDKTTAGYWSCKFWEKGKTVTDLMKG